jgi:tRNA 2-thiouridine synthesizing protein A
MAQICIVGRNWRPAVAGCLLLPAAQDFAAPLAPSACVNVVVGHDERFAGAAGARHELGVRHASASAAEARAAVKFDIRSSRRGPVVPGRRVPLFEGRLLMEIHKEVDARGLNCPLPILRAKKALADMQSGQILKVLATDPGSQRDFAAFAKQTGNEIVESSTTQDKTFVFLMRRR